MIEPQIGIMILPQAEIMSEPQVEIELQVGIMIEPQVWIMIRASGRNNDPSLWRPFYGFPFIIVYAACASI